jgi:hypothetical protein
VLLLCDWLRDEVEVVDVVEIEAPALCDSVCEEVAGTDEAAEVAALLLAVDVATNEISVVSVTYVVVKGLPLLRNVQVEDSVRTEDEGMNVEVSTVSVT